MVWGQKTGGANGHSAASTPQSCKSPSEAKTMGGGLLAAYCQAFLFRLKSADPRHRFLRSARRKRKNDRTSCFSKRNLHLKRLVGGRAAAALTPNLLLACSQQCQGKGQPATRRDPSLAYPSIRRFCDGCHRMPEAAASDSSE